MKRTAIFQHSIHYCILFILSAAISFLLSASAVLPQASPELQICRRAIPYFDENHQPPTVEFCHTIGHRTLMLLGTAGNAHVYGWDNLIVGVWDERLHRPVGNSVVLLGDGGKWTHHLESGNLLTLTLTNETLAFSEYYSTGTWLVKFDGAFLDSRCIIPPIQ